ncbi:hypothetical protein [Herbaspirillum huttiense]|uniref:hypothetical protein n=1 Tax=Herbaspirillum huttiense TaxID=863372 RepID=UPI0031D15580
MDPLDHKKTSSYAYTEDAILYRDRVGELIKKKEWRKAMAIEIRDVRRIAKNVENQKKYNEAMLEMLEYFKCLEKHGLLP